jgi:Fic family protein
MSSASTRFQLMSLKCENSDIRKLSDHTAEYVRSSLPKIYSRELVDVIFEQPYCRIGDLAEKGIAKRQTASRYLKEMVQIGVLHEISAGKEKLFLHPKLMQLITRDNNQFERYENLIKKI